jgi:hypothetical protein
MSPGVWIKLQKRQVGGVRSRLDSSGGGNQAKRQRDAQGNDWSDFGAE